MKEQGPTQQGAYGYDDTRAELAFEIFPYGPSASEAQVALRSLNGVNQIYFDPCVRRATVYFDPTKVDIPLILATLLPFAPNPRVVSVIIRKGERPEP